MSGAVACFIGGLDLLGLGFSRLSAESCLVSGMRMLPSRVYFFGVDLLEVRLLSTVLLSTVKERTIIPCKFSRDHYLQRSRLGMLRHDINDQL